MAEQQVVYTADLSQYLKAAQKIMESEEKYLRSLERTKSKVKEVATAQEQAGDVAVRAYKREEEEQNRIIELHNKQMAKIQDEMRLQDQAGNAVVNMYKKEQEAAAAASRAEQEAINKEIALTQKKQEAMRRAEEEQKKAYQERLRNIKLVTSANESETQKTISGLSSVSSATGMVTSAVAKYVGGIGLAALAWKSVSTAIQETNTAQNSLGMSSLDASQAYFRAASQSGLPVGEAKRQLHDMSASLNFRTPQEGIGVYEALSSASQSGTPQESLDAYVKFASARGLSPDQAVNTFNLLNKQGLDKDPEVMKKTLSQLFNIQKVLPTNLGQFTLAATKALPSIMGFGGSFEGGIVNLASAISLTGSETEASEFMRQFMRGEEVDPKIRKDMAKYFGMSQLDLERKYMGSTDARMAAYEKYFTENAKTPEGIFRLKENMEPTQYERSAKFYNPKAIQDRKTALAAISGVTADSFGSELSLITGSQEYKSAIEYSKGKLYGYSSNPATDRGIAELEQGKVVYKHAMERGDYSGVLGKVFAGMDYVAAGATFQSVEDLSAKRQADFSQSYRLMSHPKYKEMSEDPLLFSKIPSFNPGYLTANDIGQKAILVDRLISLMEDGNKINYQILEQMREEQNKPAKVGDPKSPNTQN